MKEYTHLSLAELQECYREGAKVEDVVMAHLKQIKETEPSIQALLTVSEEYALEKARNLDKNRPVTLPPLFGVPVTIKDALCTKGIPTTAASKILENFIPPYSATAVNKLEDAGAIIVGKNNMDEFAMGSSCENSAYQVTRNPHDISKIPGGSSGGSAASVVANQCFASLGTDTGGSVRQPAALCGCVGIKPTYGRISRYGVIAYASSLDQVGIFTRSVEDAALVLENIAGHDEKDSTSSQEKVPQYSQIMSQFKSLKNVRIGIPKEFLEADFDPEVTNAFEETKQRAKEAGANVVEVSLPHTKYALATYYILATAEASSNLARYDGVRFGHRSKDIHNLEDLYIKSRTEAFGAEVQRRILLGAFVLSAGYYDAYYKKAAQVRRLILEDYTNAFQSCSLLLSPVSPIPAWNLNAVQDPIQMYLMDIFTLSLNLAGLPGVAFPVGKTKAGLPLGMQLMGKAFDEAHLLSVAKHLVG